jgi:general secretion pathway protein A
MRRAAISRHMISCLTEAESAQYLDHKLSLAGRSLSDLMTRSAVRELVAESGCIPGHLNELAEVALARCYENRSSRITGRTVHGAIGVASARPVLERLGTLFPRPALAAMATVLLLAGCLDIVRTLYAGPASRNAAVLQAETANHSEPSPKPELFAATLLKPVDAPASEPAPPPKADSIAGAPRPGGRGLVLVAAAGDNIANMYDRVYQGLEPPPFLDVVAANAGPIRQGSLVVFPEPPHGWVAR